MWSFLAMAALMGFGGSMHCAAMCGPLARATAGRGWLGFQIGRLTAYAALGALAGSMHELMAYVASAQDALRPIWTLSLVALALLGASWVVMGRDPGWFEQGLLTAWRRVQQWRGVPPHPVSVPTPEFAVSAGAKTANTAPLLYFAGETRSSAPFRPDQDLAFRQSVWQGAVSLRSFATGACWAAIPCGLLYSAALIAWMSGSAWRGALFMALFALSSSIFQVWVHRGRLPLGGTRWQGTAYRAAGLLTVLWAGVSLWSLVIEGLPPGELCISVI